jgi:Heparinase II/III-like protein
MKTSWCVVLGAVGVMCALSAACGADYGPSFASEHPRIYVPNNRDRLTAAIASGQPEAMRYLSTMDRWVGGDDIYGIDAWQVALAGQLTGDPKYCAAAVRAVDANVFSELALINVGEAPVVAYDDYLRVGDTVGDLALVYDWCYTAIPADRRHAWLAYADQSVLNIWNYKGASWGGKSMPWVGWATDDPSDNYYYSFLRATMLVGLATHGDYRDGDTWMTEFHDTRLLGDVVPTFDMELTGGGSREGTGYGVSMRGLFHLYDLWAGSTGETISNLTPHTRASMLQFMHQTVPTLDRIAPTGDQSRDSTAAFFDFHRNYLQELIALFPGDPLAPRAKALLAESSLPEMANQFMFVFDFLYDNHGVPASTLDGAGTAYYAPGIGQLYARSGWDKHATWLNLIAGSYTQSHAHQDQGALMIYKDGWLAYDANVDSSSGLNQQIDAHGTVRIVDGGKLIEQQRDTDSTLIALHRGAGFLHAAADLTPAYKRSPVVQKVQREIVFVEPNTIVVYDRVATRAGSQQIWQLVSPAAPVTSGARTTFAGTGHKLTVDRLAPAAATAGKHEFSKDSDFSGGFRLDETVPGGDNRFLHVISIDSAVDTVTPGADGVSLSVDGKAVVVQFSRDGVGGSVSIGGQVTTLGAGVDTLPE